MWLKPVVARILLATGLVLAMLVSFVAPSFPWTFPAEPPSIRAAAD